LHHMADLYELDLSQLSTWEGMGDKKITNLKQAIEASKACDLTHFLFALGIRHVGQATARSLAQRFGSWQAIMQADDEALLGIDDIGEEVAASVRLFFAEAHNIDVLQRLQQAGVQPQSMQVQSVENDHELMGKRVVLTGTLSEIKRHDAQEGLRSLGAKISASVSKNTDIVIAGENAGSKLEKAQALGVKVVDEQQLLSWLG